MQVQAQENCNTAPVDEALRAEVTADLGVLPQQLDDDASFLTLGLDSMRLMAWMHRLRKRGHKVKLRELYEHPSLRGWSRLLRERPAMHASQTDETVQFPTPSWPNMMDGEPFALTPVQHAYLVGRAPQQTLGGVGCHLYQEFDGAGLDADALEQAISTLTERHPILLVTFLADGRQQRHPATRWRGLTLHDLRTASTEACEAHLRAMREQLGHRVLAVEQGENFDFQLTLLPDGCHRLHVNIDLLVLDAASFSLVFDDLATLLRGERLPSISTDYDFCSYLAQTDHVNETAREQARQFWMARLDSLPDAPQLPLACEPEQSGPVRISRRRVEIQAEDWARFKTRAGEHGITPTMALVTCFGAVLARWCGQPRLLLNLTLFDRLPLHPAVDTMVADFTNILMLDIAGEGAPFTMLAQTNQQTFADAYEHRHWSGVELLRELRKTAGNYLHGAPVVWTNVFHDSQHGDQNLTLYRRANTSDSYAQPTAVVLRNAPANWRDAFEIDAPSGVGRVLDALCQVLDGASVPAGFTAAHQLALAQLWLDVLHSVPPAIQRPLVAPRPITRQMLSGDSP